MDYLNSEIFKGVSQSEYMQIMTCFNPTVKNYKSGDIICSYDHCENNIGIVEAGNVSIVRIDRNGNRAILEKIGVNQLFGQVLSFYGTEDDGVFAQCSSACTVMFIDFANITKRCSKACLHHTVVVENMFNLITQRAKSLSERVEVLSQRSIREKLMCYFNIVSHGKASFTVPFSLGDLSEYLSIDRSAMMRELKNMRTEGKILQKGRDITLLQAN